MIAMATEYLRMPFGRALQERIEHAGFSQSSFAQALSEGPRPNTNQSSVSRWISLASAPKDRFIIDALALVLDCSARDLIEGRIPAEWLGARLEDEEGKMSEEKAAPVLPPEISSTIGKRAATLAEVLQEHHQRFPDDDIDQVATRFRSFASRPLILMDQILAFAEQFDNLRDAFEQAGYLTPRSDNEPEGSGDDDQELEDRRHRRRMAK